MIFRTKPESDSSDDDQSDEKEEVFWKKLPLSGQKRSISDQSAPILNKCRRNDVWLNVADELQLNDALSATHTYRLRDTSLGVESYFVSPSADEEEDAADNSEPKKNRLEGRVPCLRLEQAIPKEIDVNFESPPDLVKKTLVELLNEPNADLIGNVVDALGIKRSLQFYFLTEDVEQAGGLYLADGSRRRSKGGVFLNLIKRSDDVTPSEKRAAFGQSRKMKDRIKRKRRQLRKQLKTLMDASYSSELSSVAEVSISEEPLQREPPSTNEDSLPDLNKSQCNHAVRNTEAMEEGELLSTDDEDG